MSGLGRLVRLIIATGMLAVAAMPAGAQGTSPPAAPAATESQPQAPTAPKPAELPAAPVDVALPAAIQSSINQLGDAVDTLEKAIERVRNRDDGLVTARTDADSLLAKAQVLADILRPKLDDVRLQIDKLGKAPEKDGPAETAPIASERARLQGLASQLDGAIKSTDLFQVRTRQQIVRIQEYRRKNFTRDLFARSQSPLATGTWRQVADDLPRIGRQLATLGGYWWRDVTAQAWPMTLVLALAAAAYLGLDLAGRRLTRRTLAPVPSPLPDFFARAGTATWVATLRAAPVIVASAIAYVGQYQLGVLDYQMQQLADAILVALIIAASASGLAVATLTPRFPHWRLVDLSDASAKRLLRLTRAIAVVFATDIVLREAIRLMYLPLAVSIIETMLVSIAFAGLLIGIVRTPFAPSSTGALTPLSIYQPRWLKLPLFAIALLILVASLLGYIALGSFVTSQAMFTGLCLVAVTLLHLAIKALAAESENTARPLGRVLESRFGFDAPRRRQVSRFVAWTLNLLLVVLAIPAILLALGFSAADIMAQGKTVIFGFEIGQFRISLARILVAAGLFATIVFCTRLLQRWLLRSVLTPARMDPGIANSVYTGIGYSGVALAGLFAVSYAGFDITNLAIVAGALSVGIGFGLQSIVNNFVSGLILLVERPVKVGDWIVVKGQEGYVRRISVRATEIETFDRASLILPNSDLITSAVTNWTHRNAMGRIVIKVGASYDCDPEQVMRILTEVGAANAYILQYPKPAIVFENFGDNALEFSLRAVVADITAGLDAQNSLRVEIFKAFKAAGIDIPFPQRQVRLSGDAGALLRSSRRGRRRQPANA